MKQTAKYSKPGLDLNILAPPYLPLNVYVKNIPLSITVLPK